MEIYKTNKQSLINFETKLSYLEFVVFYGVCLAIFRTLAQYSSISRTQHK